MCYRLFIDNGGNYAFRKYLFNSKGFHDDLEEIAQIQNSRKIVLNFWDEDWRKEYIRLKELDISDNITKIKYVCNISPYYYFQMTDPDGNIIEVTEEYIPEEGEFLQ